MTIRGDSLLRLRSFFPYFILVLLFFSFHHKVVFQGKVYYNLWLFQNHAPFPPADPKSINFFNASLEYITHYFPYKHYLTLTFREGLLPLWNPYVFCGFPIFANGNTCVFSPFNVLLLFWHPYRAYVVLLALFFLMGSFALFYFLEKCLKLTRTAALAGAAALLLCPHLLQFIDYDTMLAFVWSFPVSLMLAHRLRETRGFRWIGLTALFLFLTGLAGHVHGLVNTLVLFTAYYFCLKGNSPSAANPVFRWMVVMLLFFGLSLFWLWPTAVFFRESHWLPELQGNSLNPKAPLSLLTSVYPLLGKFPVFSRFLSEAVNDRISFSSAVLVGILPFLAGLASCFAFFDFRAGRTFRFFSFFVLAYHVSTALPFTYLVPGAFGQFLNVAFFKFWQFYAFSSWVVTAYALDALLNLPFRRYFAWVVRGVFFLVVLPVTLGSLALSFFPDFFRVSLLEFLKAKGILPQESYYLGRFSELFGQVSHFLSIRSVGVWVPLAVVSVLFVMVSRRFEKLSERRRAWFKGFIFFLLAVELFLIGRQLLPTAVDESAVWPKTAVTEFLKKDASLFRIMSIQTTAKPGEGIQRYVLKPNLGIPYGLYDAGGMDSMTNGRYLHFAQKYLTGRPEVPFSRFGQLDFETVNAPMAGLLNVKYVLASDKRQLDEEGLEPVLTADGLTLYRNRYVLPRIFFTGKVRPFKDFETVYREMQDPSFYKDPWVYVESGEEALSGRLSGAAAVAAPVFKRLTPNVIEVEAQTAGRGILVFTDTFDKGWKVYDNDEKRTLERVNGLFKGVFLESGAHRVKFVYRPEPFFAGLWVSCMVFLLTFFLVVGARFGSGG